MSTRSDLIPLTTFRSTAEAQIAKGVLDEAGIESVIRSDNAGGMYPAMGEVELLVRSEDLEVPGGSVRAAAKVWGVSKTTAAKWIAEGRP
jgi:hypothetical protein